MSRKLKFVENGKEVVDQDRVDAIQNQLDMLVNLFKTGELGETVAKMFIHSKVEKPMSRWSVNNMLGIFFMGGTDARGWRQWEKVGREVIQDYKDNPQYFILTPMFTYMGLKYDEHGNKIPLKTRYGKLVKGKGGKPLFERHKYLSGFKVVPVWDISETTGDPVEEDEELLHWVENLPLMDVANFLGVDVSLYSGEGSGAYGWYMPTTQKIGLGVQDLQTWAHELMHAADRNLGNLKINGGQDPEAEAVAETGSMVILSMLGMTEDIDYRFGHDYIARYAKQIDVDTDVIIKRVSNRIIEAVRAILDLADILASGENPSDFAKWENVAPAGHVMETA